MYQPNLPPPEDRLSVSNRPRIGSKVVGWDQTLKQPQRQRSIRQISRQNSIPAWLQSLLKLQRGVKILFGGIFGLSLIVYGYTVYTQDLWKQQHGQLKRLQTQERQQGVMNENLKQQLAESAEQPQSELVEPDPHKIIFMPSAPQRPVKSPATASSAKTNPNSKPPLGY